MEYGALVSAGVTVAGISERSELVVVRRESLPNNFGGLLKDDHHKCAHQEGGIRLLIKFG